MANELTVNLQIDASPECLKRLCNGLAAAVKPDGGYKAATTDDRIAGASCDQMVQAEWWIPQHGCDSLENTLDAIKARLLVAVQDWWATALVPATTPAPEEGPSDEDLLRTYGLAKRDHCYEGDIDDWPQKAERAATVAGIRAVLTRWAHPAAPPAPASGDVGELVEFLDSLAALPIFDRDCAARIRRTATLLQQLSDLAADAAWAHMANCAAALLQQQVAPAPAVVPVAVEALSRLYWWGGMRQDYGYNADAVLGVRDWIDGGMVGGLPPLPAWIADRCPPLPQGGEGDS